MPGLIEKYRHGGVEGMTDGKVFSLAPFNSDVRRAAQPFGSMGALRKAVDDLVRLLCARDAA